MSLFSQDNGFPAQLPSTTSFTVHRPSDPSPLHQFFCRSSPFLLRDVKADTSMVAHGLSRLRCSSSDRQQSLQGKERRAKIVPMKRGNLRDVGVVDLRRRAAFMDEYSLLEGEGSQVENYAAASEYAQQEANLYNSGSVAAEASVKRSWPEAQSAENDLAMFGGRPLDEGLSMVFNVMDIEGKGVVSTDTIKDVFMELG
jgi:hypothetical protein